MRNSIKAPYSEMKRPVQDKMHENQNAKIVIL